MNKIAYDEEVIRIREVIKSELIKYRKEFKLTQTDVANKLNTSQSFYQELENDVNRDVGIAKLLAYCKTLTGNEKLFVKILEEIVKEIESNDIKDTK